MIFISYMKMLKKIQKIKIKNNIEIVEIKKL